MSRSSENHPTPTRTRVFPFRSRTASSEKTSSDTSGEQQQHRPKKLNSLFHFNKMEDNDYNQARQPYTPELQTNHRLYPNGRTLDVDDDDDHSDNGTVQPGEGRYTLRVINPDPVSDSSSDEEEQEQESHNNKKEDQQRNQQPMGSTPCSPPTTATHVRPPLPSAPSAKLEIAAPIVDSSDRPSTTAYVTQFLSTASSSTTSSLSLASSSAQHTQVTATAGSHQDMHPTTTSSVAATHGSSNNTTPTTTTAPASLNRRQSKTLHEKPGSVELLPPLDLDPLDWSTFTSDIKSAKRLSNIPRVVLGPVVSSTITTTNNEQQEATTSSRPTMFMDQEQLVETPLTLTPRTSQSSMQPLESRSEAPPPPIHTSLLSPSDSGIISPSLYRGQRSIATTTHESVLVSTNINDHPT